MARTLGHARAFRIAAFCGGFAFGSSSLGAQRGGASDRPVGQPPVLTAFAINSGADTVSAAVSVVRLDHTVVGTRPSEYRVSHRADFAGAAWLPYVAAPTLRDWYDAAGEWCDATHTARRIVLHLQVRASVGEEVKIVDGQRQLVPARVESNVLRATVCAFSARSLDE